MTAEKLSHAVKSSQKKNGNNIKTKPKLTKEERRVKYTRLAREKKNQARTRFSPSNPKDKAKICYACRKRGHSMAQCPLSVSSSPSRPLPMGEKADNITNNCARATTFTPVAASERPEANQVEQIKDGDQAQIHTKEGQKEKDGSDDKSNKELTLLSSAGEGVAQAAARTARGLCFKCGSTQHGLSSCPHYRGWGNTPKPTLAASSAHQGGTDNQEQGHDQYRENDDAGYYLPFATCFICRKSGHLAATCPQNAKGIYIHGGACQICGSKRHLSAHCPQSSTPGGDRNPNSHFHKLEDQGNDDGDDYQYLLVGQGDDQPAMKHERHRNRAPMPHLRLK